MLYYFKFDLLRKDTMGASSHFLWAFYDEDKMCYHLGYCIDDAIANYCLNRYYYFNDSFTIDPIEL